jgi:NNP family nitrate/nitrite transporter-like MFS transporter
MDNLSHVRNEKRAMRDVVGEPHAWVMSLLYIGTFGSFIGFGFAFGQVLQVQFADTFDTPIKAAYLTFLGPLLGSLLRPVGGRLADRLGGARVTVVVFVAMTAGASLVLVASRIESLALFLVAFVVLFVLTGLGNGSTYKMIPAIFSAKARTAVTGGAAPADAQRDAKRLSRGLIGVCGAIGALGGVAVNLVLRQSFVDTGKADNAYMAFIAFYAVCVVVTWAVYLRPSSRRLEGV